jgi:hypothetical protein
MLLQNLYLESARDVWCWRILLCFSRLLATGTVYILVSEDHTTYQETFSKLEAKSTILLDLDDPSTSMHCYEATVVKNSQLNREELKNLLTPKGGGAVAFEFLSVDAGGIELKWAEFFQNLNHNVSALDILRGRPCDIFR